MFFEGSGKSLLEDVFKPCDLLYKNCDISIISPNAIFDKKDIVDRFNKKYNTSFTSTQDIYSYLENEKCIRFKLLIDKNFTNGVLLDLLNLFKTRTKENDAKILSIVNCDADVPTIFEYVVGILWYKISEYKGNILEYMNLSLDTSLLPLTHASGGESDIVYKYDSAAEYPSHTLLIECTLMEGTTQRRGEMEPVSRHLSNYLIDVDKNAYCTFISNNLHPSVLSDFRMRKGNTFYRNERECVEDMKILALDINELKIILKNNITYAKIYKIFEDAYSSSESNPTTWYITCIKKVLEKC